MVVKQLKYKFMSLSNQIITKLQEEYPQWVHSGELERLAMQNGYKASNGGRRARELVNAGKIQKSYDKKNTVVYKYIPHSDNDIAQKFLEDFGPFKGKELQEQLDKLTLF